MEDTFLQSHWLDLVILVAGIVISILLYAKYKSSKYVNFITYIPNVWTSLGVLGTFVSIYISLNQFDFKNEIDVGLLVKMIAPAFSTSIMGIIGALISSMFIRFKRATEDVKEENSYVSTIKNIERQVNSLGTGAREIARDMGREMVEAAGEGLRESLYQHIRAMSRAMDQEERNFTALAASISENLNMVSAVHNDTMRNLYSQYRQEAEQVRRECEMSLREMKEHMCSDIIAMSEEHSRHIADISQRQIDHLSSIDESIKASVERSFVALSEQVYATVGEIAMVTSSLASTRSGFEEVSQAVAKAGESFEKVKDSLAGSRAELDKVVAECSQRMALMTTNMTNTIQKEAENASAVHALLRQADMTISKLETVTQKMTIAISNAAKASIPSGGSGFGFKTPAPVKTTMSAKPATPVKQKAVMKPSTPAKTSEDLPKPAAQPASKETLKSKVTNFFSRKK